MYKESVMYRYIQMNILLALKKNILPFATTCMKLGGIMVVEIRQAWKDTAWYYLEMKQNFKSKTPN